MLVYRLLGAIWWLIGAEVLFFGLDVLGVMKQRGIRGLIVVVPWVFPLACVALFAWAARHDRRVESELRASGAAATATVLEVRDQGIDVGVNPVLLMRIRVAAAGGRPFETELGIMPSRLDMAFFREGVTLPVRYDPRDHGRIMLDPSATSGATQ